MEKKKEKEKRRWGVWLSNILGGDILANEMFRKQWKLMVLIMALILFYIDNRYSCQQQLIEFDKLKVDLTDIKYDALTRSSELMEKSRQSKIQEYIESKQSDLEIANTPPYLIK
jgi:hypothetical protein